MSLFRNLDCLSLIVCNNTPQNQTIFSKFCASKSGVGLIYRCSLRTDVYGILCFPQGNNKEIILCIAQLLCYAQDNLFFPLSVLTRNRENMRLLDVEYLKILSVFRLHSLLLQNLRLYLATS